MLYTLLMFKRCIWERTIFSPYRTLIFVALQSFHAELLKNSFAGELCANN